MTKTFSFFYSRGSSAYVRGEQMADYLGGKKNPKRGYENDVCIYIKILPPENPPKKSYCDVDDSEKSFNYLLTHPKMGVIANSYTAKDFLVRSLKRTDIKVIPHAHCNYEKKVRMPTQEVKTVGIIGSITSFQYPIEPFKEELRKIGLDLVYEANYWDTYRNTPDKPGRLKVCDFYKNIDVQVVYRPKMITPYFKNPNKLINAGSFCVPTVAYPEYNFEYEWKDHYYPAATIPEMIEILARMKSDYYFYYDMAIRAMYKADEYHITKIAELYREL